MSSSTQAALVHLQVLGSGGGSSAPTALSDLGGTIDPTQERQFLQGFGESFARSMDVNGDGTVTEGELVGKLNAGGTGLPDVLGERLFGQLSPGDAPLSETQLAVSATAFFAPSWLNASGD